MQLSIVSYLDKPATVSVRELQKTMSEITGSTASLYSWQPHITLGDGVEVTAEQLEALVTALRTLGERTPAFDIRISGFSSFASRPIGSSEVSTPYAIFADVIADSSLLGLVNEVGKITNTHSVWYYMPRPYTPHVTLAFRDLSEAGYKKGLEHLSQKDIQLTSTIDHIALVQKLSDLDVELVHMPLNG